MDTFLGICVVWIVVRCLFHRVCAVFHPLKNILTITYGGSIKMMHYLIIFCVYRCVGGGYSIWVVLMWYLIWSSKAN